MFNPSAFPADFYQHAQSVGLSSSLSSPETGRETKRKTNHNEAEKRRVKKINDTIDEIKDLLDKDGIIHKKDKVSILESSVIYIKQLLIERDRLSCKYGQIQSIIPTQQTKEDREKENNSDGISESVDYKSVWTYSSISSVVVNIETGEFIKGNKQFYKHFCFSNPESLRSSNMFEMAAENDMPLLWSEITHLANLKRKTTRSFVATYKRGAAAPLRCLTILGNITDVNGNYTLMTLSLLPVTSHGIHKEGFQIPTFTTPANQYEDPSAYNPLHYSFPISGQDTDSTNYMMNPTQTNNQGNMDNSQTEYSTDSNYYNSSSSYYMPSSEQTSISNPSDIIPNPLPHPLSSSSTNINNINNNSNNSNNSNNNSNNNNNNINNNANNSNNSNNNINTNNNINNNGATSTNDNSYTQPLPMTAKVFSSSLSEKRFNIPSFPLTLNVEKTLQNQ
ncbi:hypothetical protein WA158_002176 [Blastocystis sp. Blastoise]